MRLGSERATERRGCPADLLAYDPGKVRLVSESQLGRELSEVPLAFCEPLEREANAHAVAVPGHRLAGLAPEDPAQVMRRDRCGAGELNEAATGIGCDRLARHVDGSAAQGCGRRAHYGLRPALDRHQHLGSESDGTVRELELVTGRQR